MDRPSLQRLIALQLCAVWAVLCVALCRAEVPQEGADNTHRTIKVLDLHGERPPLEVPATELPRMSRPNSPANYQWQNVIPDDSECGINALYIFLRAHDIGGVRLDELRAKLKASSQGVSLLQLRDAAHSFGQDVEAVECSPEDLTSFPLPVIALMGRATDKEAGHYVVISSASDSKVDFIDGTNLMSVANSSTSFAHNYSGFALVVPREGFAKYRYATLMLLGAIVIVETVMLARVAGTRPRGKQKY